MYVHTLKKKNHTHKKPPKKTPANNPQLKLPKHTGKKKTNPGF